MAVQSAVSGALSLTLLQGPWRQTAVLANSRLNPEVYSMRANDSNREEMIHAFTEQHRLPTTRETDGTTVIPGRAGCQLYEYSDSELGLIVLSDAKDSRPRRWAGIRKKCLDAGMMLRQNGEAEGALSFNPANRQQSLLAVKVTGARPKRQLSPEHRAKLLAVGFQKRQCPTLKSGLQRQKATRNRGGRVNACPPARMRF